MRRLLDAPTGKATAKDKEKIMNEALALLAFRNFGYAGEATPEAVKAYLTRRGKLNPVLAQFELSTFFVDVLGHVAQGRPGARELAAAALIVNSAEFERFDS